MSIQSNHSASLRRAQTLLLAVLLFLMNAYVCRGLFGVEYLRHMGSIEAAYIGLSRYMLAHWRDLSWFPLWYAGVPAQNTYPPLLHWMVALAAFLRGISPAHAHHWVTAIFYCLGPVALFALTLRLSGSLRAAFIAGALYSALSPSAWLMPEVARFEPRLALDGGPDGLDFYRRLAIGSPPFLKPDGKIMLEFGDGQAEAIKKIFEDEKWVVEAVKEDYSQRARILIIKSSSSSSS